MKLLPMFEYVYFRYGITKTNIGFRYDEWERGYIIKPGEKHVKKSTGTMAYPISCNNFGSRLHNWDHNIVWQEKNYPLIDNQVFHIQIQSYWAKEHPEFIFPQDSNCQGCHHKPPALIKRNRELEPDILEWFALQEEKKQKYGKAKYYTWHDTGIMYRKVFNMNFTQEFDFDYTMCNSGGCTD